MRSPSSRSSPRTSPTACVPCARAVPPARHGRDSPSARGAPRHRHRAVGRGGRHHGRGGAIEYVNPAFERVTGYTSGGGPRPEPAHPQERRPGPGVLRRDVGRPHQRAVLRRGPRSTGARTAACSRRRPSSRPSATGGDDHGLRGGQARRDPRARLEAAQERMRASGPDRRHARATCRACPRRRPTAEAICRQVASLRRRRGASSGTSPSTARPCRSAIVRADGVPVQAAAPAASSAAATSASGRRRDRGWKLGPPTLAPVRAAHDGVGTGLGLCAGAPPGRLIGSWPSRRPTPARSRAHRDAAGPARVRGLRRCAGRPGDRGADRGWQRRERIADDHRGPAPSGPSSSRSWTSRPARTWATRR